MAAKPTTFAQFAAAAVATGMAVMLGVKAEPAKAPGLIVKHALPVEGGAVAVAFWGGMLKITAVQDNPGIVDRPAFRG